MRRLTLLVCLSACTSPPSPESAIITACQQTVTLSRDRSNGLLSPTEIREKARAIHQQAQTGTATIVSTASEELLRELTTGEPEKVSDRILGLLDACDTALTKK